MKRSLVIIGSTMAAMGCLNKLSNFGNPDLKITLVTEDGLPINQAFVQEFLTGKIDLCDLNFHPLQWYQERGIDLILDCRVETIDDNRSELILSDGRAIRFDHLIVDGYSFRQSTDDSYNFPDLVDGCSNFEELERLGPKLQKGKKAIVIGDSLSVLGVSLSLAARGLSVQIVDNGEFLLQPLLDLISSSVVVRRLNLIGIEVAIGSVVSEIELDQSKQRSGDKECISVFTAAGKKFQSDIVILASHVDRSFLDLFPPKSAGKCYVKDCSGLFRTNGSVIVLDPAIGSFNSNHDFTFRWELGEYVANSLLGMGNNWVPRPSVGRISAPGMELAIYGDPAASDQEIEKTVILKNEAKNTFKRITVNDGQITEAVIVGDRDSVRRITAVASGFNLAIDATEILFSDPMALKVNTEFLSGDSIVCECNRVAKSEIESVADEIPGCGNVEPMQLVIDKTRASTGCGSCREIVKSVVNEFQKRKTVANELQVGSELVGV